MTGRIAENKRMILGAGIFIAVIFLWYNFIFVGQRNELKRIHVDIAEIESLVTAWMIETRNLSDYHDEYVTLEKERKRFLSTVPGTREVQVMAEEIIKTGKNNDCVVKYVGIPFADLFSHDDGENPSGQDEVLILPFQLIANGHYVPIGRFMQALEELPYFASFGELEIRRAARSGDELESNFEMMVYIRRETEAVNKRL